MIRSGLVALLLLVFASTAFAADDYVVLVGVPPGDPYYAAATRLANHHGSATLLSFNPSKPDAVFPGLASARPRHVALVVRPEQIDVNGVRRFLRLSTRLDNDPFCDFSYGYITGATAEEALAFVDRIIEANEAKRPAQVARASVRSGTAGSAAGEGTYVLGDLEFPLRTLFFTAPDGKHGRDQAFIDEHLSKLEGSGAILLGGHGMPWEIGSGPRAEDLDGLDLFPAVAFNYACYTGVTHRWPKREFAGDSWVHRIQEVEAKRSFALAMIRAGVTGYVAYVNPRPAGPEMTIDLERVLAGESLGDVRRNDYAKIALGYLGFGEKGIVPPPFVDGEKLLRADVDPVRHMMLDGGTGGILYGDPAFRPYPLKPGSLPLKTKVTRKGDEFHITMSMPGRQVYLWGSDPYRRFDESSMALKLYDRVELPEGVQTIRSVWVAEATWGGKAIDTLDPVWAIERDHGRRYLHVKANFRRSGRGDVEIRLVASPKEAPLDLRKKADCIRLAEQVGERIMEKLESIEDAWVYDGKAGVALFLFDLYGVTKNERWLEPARQLLESAAKATDESGLYVGVAGVAQVALDAWRTTKDDSYLEMAKTLAAGIGEPEATDVISGAAGTGIFWLNLYAATGDETHLAQARSLGETLESLALREDGKAHWRVSKGLDRVYIGFSHGAAGIGYFLLHLGRSTGETRWLDLAREAASYVVSKAVDDPPDGWKWTKRDPPAKDAYPVQWCHGSPGIGLFFLALADTTGETEHEAALGRCVAANRRRGRTARGGGCQCHGKAGNAELFLEVHRSRPDPDLVTLARTFAADLVDGNEVRSSIGKHTYAPGYMTGLAGIGRFFLRLADPKAVPLPMMVAGDGPDPILEAVRKANREALRAGAASDRAVEGVAKLGAPGFRAVCRLIAAGEGHWRTHELLRVTWVPGGEEILRKLADGPPLPKYGRWTALRGLGVVDTPAVRTFLLERLAHERDAGLFMSTAKALAMLKEEKAADLVGRQVRKFEKGWSGVETHLLSGLTEMGPGAIPHLKGFLADDRATREVGLMRALRGLAQLDGEAAAEAARGLRDSDRYAALGAAVKAEVDRLAK